MAGKAAAQGSNSWTVGWCWPAATQSWMHGTSATPMGEGRTRWQPRERYLPRSEIWFYFLYLLFFLFWPHWCTKSLNMLSFVITVRLVMTKLQCPCAQPRHSPAHTPQKPQLVIFTLFCMKVVLIFSFNSRQDRELEYFLKISNYSWKKWLPHNLESDKRNIFFSLKYTQVP